MSPHRRIEDRIKELCDKVISVQRGEEVKRIIGQLNEALREHQRRAHERLTQQPIARDRRA